jgi:hypothetical protein
MSKIDVDVCANTKIELHEYCAQLIAGTDVSYSVLKWVSSSGGWPIVEFSGEIDQLTAIVREWAGPNGDAEFHVSRIAD